MMQEAEFLQWFAEVLAIRGRSLDLADRRETITEWDSLGSLLLLMRFEEDHKVVVEVAELERVESIKDLYALFLQKA